jgi:hypothetical protein
MVEAKFKRPHSQKSREVFCKFLVYRPSKYRLASVAATSMRYSALGFDYRKNFPIFAVQTIITNLIPRLSIVAIHRDFDLHFGVVAQIPTRSFKLRVDPAKEQRDFHLLAGELFGDTKWAGHVPFPELPIFQFLLYSFPLRV